MTQRCRLPRVGLSELLVVVGVLIMLGAIVAPVWTRDYKDDLTKCLSQTRQMVTACAMNNQDHNGRFPGTDWANEIAQYLGNTKAIFHCPADENSGITDPVSYGYSGLLVRTDGTGVNEAQIKSPTEVGVLCDAAPTRPFPNGGLIGGGLQDYAAVAVQPLARHDQSIVIGYADGHAKVCTCEPNDQDAANPITRAFYTASTIGLIDNPAGGISKFQGPAAPDRTTLCLGGEYCTYPLLVAAAESWKQLCHAPYMTQGFRGQDAVKNRPADYLWGCADGSKPQGKAIPIARDAVVMIVATNCRIDIPAMRGEDGTCALDESMIWGLFSIGYQANRFQAYTYSADSGTRRYFCAKFAEDGKPLEIGKQAIVVINDVDMVDKIANDPYGIGYCSSVFVDPQRVQVVDLRLADGSYARFPRKDLQHRWEYPAATSWPLMRTLYAVCGGQAEQPDGNTLAATMLAPGAAGTRALQAGPLFKAGYFKP